MTRLLSTDQYFKMVKICCLIIIYLFFFLPCRVYLLSDPEQTNGPPLSPKQASLPPSFKPAQSIPDVILYNGRNKVFLRHSSVEITGSCTSCRVSAAQRKHIFLYFWYIVIDQCIFTWLVFLLFLRIPDK